MPVLSDNDRASTRSEWADLLSSIRESFALTKADGRAAVDATDEWINDNVASYNSALPEIARNNLTGNQKARLFLLVAEKD